MSERFLLLLFILVSSCSTNGDAKSKGRIIQSSDLKFHVENREGQFLTLKYSDETKSQLLLKSENFDYILSPDSKKLAVNTALASNLHISEVYALKDRKKIGPADAINLSSQAWKPISQKLDLKLEEILFPRTNIYKWNDLSTAVQVRVRGETEEGKIIEDYMEIEIR